MKLDTPISLLAAVAAVAAVALAACSPDGTSSGTGGSAQGGGAAQSGGSDAASGGGPTASVGSGGSTGSSGGSGPTSTTASSTSVTVGTGGGGPCPSGVTCVDTFPFTDDRDTSTEGTTAIDSYPCAAETNESGPEIVYRVTVPTDGFLSAAVYDGDGVDIDVHILTDFDPAAPSPATCVSRGDHHASADVAQGDVWIVADTWSSAANGPQPGAYKIDIGFIGPSVGPCAMQSGEMARVGDDGDHLAMPATGPVVIEAHLVTQEEPPPYPSTATEELAAHYALSQQRTGLVMYREQVWAPLEGGSFYGAGIGDPADFPVVDEGWYVNMYWTPAARPARGSRMILRLPEDPSRAVVVAAGYETGPGNLAHVAGTPEETHFYLGTGHLSEMTIGIAQDQTLPLGPRRCTD